MEKQTIKFTGCEHLDFNDSYIAKKELISTCGGVKVCWDRFVIDESYPKLVQFCKLRGRLNHPEMCLCEKYKQCSYYKEIEHSVELEINQ